MAAIDTSSREAFARTAGPYAREIEAETGIPADIMLAIAINEGALKAGTVASTYNNVMGIKAGSDWEGPTSPKMSVWEVEKGHDVRRPATFRAYESPAESFRDFATLLQTSPRYADAMQFTADPARFMRELKNANYATDPAWPDKVLKIARSIAPALGEGEGMAMEAPGGGVVFPVEGFTAKDVPKHWDVHRGAADLFAPRGTPVKAMRGGTVTSVGSSGPGGNNIQIQGDDGLQYYYAHLNDFGPGLERGGRVEAGQVLGGVGDTGNAKGKGHHLHIGIGKSIASGTGAAGGAGTDFDATTYLNQALRGGGGGVEPGTPGRPPGAAAEYEQRAKADIDRAAAGLEQLRDPQWRADFIARLQHDRGFRENALVKGRKPGDLERTLAQLEEETESPNDNIRSLAWRDIERSYDLAAQAAEAELTKEETRRETVYSRAKDDYKAALGGAGREEVQALDIQLKIAQLDKALNPPGPQRTPEQRALDIATARQRLQEVEVRIPAQADRDRAAAQQAAAQTDKIRRDLIPKQLRVLQEGVQTIAHIRDEWKAGRITPEQADQYYTSVQQYVTSGLRGSTPAEEDKLRIQEATKRAEIGKDILNQQVQSGTALAGNLSRDYQQLLAKTLEPPGEYDPLQRASLFTAGMGGGFQNPSTLDISGQLIGALGGAPQMMPQATGAPGMNWAQAYPGVPLASAVPAGAGAAAMAGGEEEIPEDAEMSAEDYSRILAEVFTEEEDQAEEEEDYE